MKFIKSNSTNNQGQKVALVIHRTYGIEIWIAYRLYMTYRIAEHQYGYSTRYNYIISTSGSCSIQDIWPEQDCDETGVHKGVSYYLQVHKFYY